jgi:hypothetical protein
MKRLTFILTVILCLCMSANVALAEEKKEPI